MTDEFKRAADQIWQVIQKSQNILLHLHPNPDPDSAGSALAMYWALKSIGKNPTVIKGDSDKPNWLNFLPGGDQILDNNFSDIDLSKFDLFIIQDSSSLEQISKLSTVIFPESLETVVIDHHVSNIYYAKTNLVSSTYPATCCLDYELLKYWDIAISPEIAANLFAGIHSDTGGFKYSPTNSDTFQIAKELVEIYPNFSDLIFNIENQQSPETLVFIGLALSNIHTYGSNNNVVLSEVSYTQLTELNIAKKHTQNTDISNMLHSVIGWDVATTFIETEPNKVSLSLRTRDSKKYNVSKIAVALGGGGHHSAAGATLNMSFVEAKKFLLDTIYSIYPDLKPQ